MLKFIGALVLIGGMIFGFAYFGGYVGSHASVNITPKGHAAVQNVREEVGNGLNAAGNMARGK